MELPLLHVLVRMLLLVFLFASFGSAQLSTTAEWPKVGFNNQGTGQCPYLLGVASRPYVLWSYQTYYGGAIIGSPVMTSSGDIVFGAIDRAIYCISNAGTVKWAFDAEGYVTGSPTITADSVIIGSYSGKIYALNITTGTLQWNFTTGGVIGNSAAVTAAGDILMSSSDKSLYCLSRAGSLRWTFFTNSSAMSTPSISPDGSNIVVGSGTRLFSLSLAGEMLWNFSAKTTGIVNTQFAIAQDGSISSVCGNTLYYLTSLGSVKWTYNVVGDISTAPAIATSDGSIIFGTCSYFRASGGRNMDHHLYSISSAGSLNWRY